jgi:peptide deformylase
MSVISTAFALFVNNPHQRRHTTRSITTTIQKTLYHSSNTNNNYDGQQRNNNNGILTTLFSSPPSKEEIDPGVVEGTDLRIVKYPHPCLRAKNDEVALPDEQESISKLAKEMLKVMYAAEGVGLAAPQVGVNKRLMVYNPTGDSKKWLEEKILVNPQIVEFSEAKDEDIEGCLSFPQMNGEVIRSKWIKVEGTLS